MWRQGEKSQMNVKIDFTLSARFSIVEKTIFRLVIGGVRDIKTITSLLCVYSDDVIANAIKKLVNYQILRANFEARLLFISEPLLAMIESCMTQSQDLELPEGMEMSPLENIAYITDENTKRQILSALLPGVNIGFLVKSVDFVINERGVKDEQQQLD